MHSLKIIIKNLSLQDYVEIFITTVISIIKILQIGLKMIILDEIILHNGKQVINLVISYSFCQILFYFLDCIRNIAAWKNEKANRYKIIEKIADKINSFPLEYAEQLKVQEISQKSDDFYKKHREFLQILFSFVDATFISIFLCVLVYNISFYLIILTLFFIITISLINLRISYKTKGFWGQYMKNARRFNYLSDILTRREYAFEKRIFKFEEQIEQKFTVEFRKARNINVKSAITRFKLQLLVESIIIAGTIFSITAFIPALSSHILTLGKYTVLVETISLLLELISRISGDFYKYTEYAELLDSMFYFITNDKNYIHSCRNISNVHKNEIILRNVQFTYPKGGKQVLNDICYTFKKGKSYGVVGLNGAGKTTLIKLLLGLYRPTGGRIDRGDSFSCISGYDMVLFQDFNNYPLTIKEFILLGNRKNILDDDIKNALNKVNMLEDIMKLDKNIYTPLSILISGGTLLSKGQLQRLGIARAFLSESQLIVLDEPTANLDPISERELYEQCFEIFSTRTTFYITHRLAAVKKADEIIVLNEGSIVEHGCHEALMQMGGIYSNLYSVQRGLYEEVSNQ